MVMDGITRACRVNHNEQTPLHVACACNEPEPGIISELLKVGRADPNAQDNQGQTPLHSIAASGNLRSLSLLVNAGADRTVCVKTWLMLSLVLNNSLRAPDQGLQRFKLR